MQYIKHFSIETAAGARVKKIIEGKLGTSQILTSLPVFYEYARKILRNPSPPRANHASNTVNIPHITPPFPGVGEGGGWGFN